MSQGRHNLEKRVESTASSTVGSVIGNRRPRVKQRNLKDMTNSELIEEAKKYRDISRTGLAKKDFSLYHTLRQRELFDEFLAWQQEEFDVKEIIIRNDRSPSKTRLSDGFLQAFRAALDKGDYLEAAKVAEKYRKYPTASHYYAVIGYYRKAYEMAFRSNEYDRANHYGALVGTREDKSHMFMPA